MDNSEAVAFLTQHGCPNPSEGLVSLIRAASAEARKENNMFEYKTVSATCHSRIKMESDDPWWLRGIDNVLNRFAADRWEHYHTVFVPEGATIDEINGNPAVILHLRRELKEQRHE